MAVAIKALESVSNDAEFEVDLTAPYVAHVTIEGVAPLLFHRWSVEAVAASKAKGSIAKKTDNIESYVWRAENGNLALPGEYLRQAVIHAAKFRQDPRSPRKSAMDLFRAGLLSLTELADLGQAEWDYIDQRRVTVQRAGITRQRPALAAGWVAQVDFLVNLPEYISIDILREVIVNAGRLIGVADFRPTYGRFQMTNFSTGLD